MCHSFQKQEQLRINHPKKKKKKKKKKPAPPVFRFLSYGPTPQPRKALPSRQHHTGAASTAGTGHRPATLGWVGPPRPASMQENGDAVAVAAADDDDIWGDASDSPGHESTLDREWSHRQNQFHKMGYRDGITEGQRDSAQEGFNVGFRQSVNVGYNWGLVRGLTSALASLPDSLKEKLLPDVNCTGKLLDLHNSVQVISADDAFQMFHHSVGQNSNPSGEPHVTSGQDGATNSNRLKTLSKDLVLLLHQCPDVKVGEELA